MCMLVIGGNQMMGQIVYPTSRKVDTVDVYYNQKVKDPYRWLEDDHSKETAAWVDAQNTVTQNYISKISFRNSLKEQMTHAINYERMALPQKKNGKYYYFKNNGLQNQSVLYVADELNGKAEVLLDPNTFSKDGTVALQNISFSNDGRFLAYIVSRSGSDWQEILVMDLVTRCTLKDHISWAKFTSAEWYGNGFFYSAYDAPKEGDALKGKNEYHKVYYHKIGTEQDEDQLVYENKKYPLRFYNFSVSEDERYIFLTESEGDGAALYIKDMQAANPQFVEITHNIKEEMMPVQTVGDKIYVKTNVNAPNYRLIAFDAQKLAPDNFEVIIPEGKHLLNQIMIAGDKLVVTYIENVAAHAYIYSLDGKKEREIKLPSTGMASFSGDKGDNELFYSFTSFTYPGVIFSYNLDNHSSKMVFSPKVDFNPADYVTEQVSYPSKDGTMINLFITYKKGLKRNGKNPTLLYGYGGFNVNLNPSFNALRIPFLNSGGIYALANLRGGGEFGEAWHQAGTKMKKQNVFDDFVAAAQYLIKQKYTSPQKLAVNGGSNGGLLVGAVVNQHPELFKAAVPQVGVMDMLRYHLFTIGWNWAGDYGRSDDSEEMFRYLLGYSPLHNIKNDGTKYPAILITTADHDDRVVPAHSFKYAATLQAANTGKAPKLIRIDTKAGHGGGKPIGKIIEENADIYSFIMYNLGMTLKE